MPELWQDNDSTKPVRLERILQKARIRPRFTLSAPDGTVATNIDARVFRDGDVTIIGLQREGPVSDTSSRQDVVLGFDVPVYAYDLRHTVPPQHGTRVRLPLGAVAPAVIAMSLAPLSPLSMEGPAQAQLGTVAEFAIRSTGSRPAATRIVHAEAIATDGMVVAGTTTNFALRGRRAVWRLPLALNDPTGSWTIRMADVLADRKTECTLAVHSSATAPSIPSP
jgi:hypothetical protein